MTEAPLFPLGDIVSYGEERYAALPGVANETDLAVRLFGKGLERTRGFGQGKRFAMPGSYRFSGCVERAQDCVVLSGTVPFLLPEVGDRCVASPIHADIEGFVERQSVYAPERMKKVKFSILGDVFGVRSGAEGVYESFDIGYGKSDDGQLISRTSRMWESNGSHTFVAELHKRVGQPFAEGEELFQLVRDDWGIKYTGSSVHVRTNIGGEENDYRYVPKEALQYKLKKSTLRIAEQLALPQTIAHPRAILDHILENAEREIHLHDLLTI